MVEEVVEANLEEEWGGISDDGEEKVAGANGTTDAAKKIPSKKQLKQKERRREKQKQRQKEKKAKGKISAQEETANENPFDLLEQAEDDSTGTSFGVDWEIC